MMEVARPGEAKLPRAVKEILQASLKLRDRRDRNRIGERGLAIARGQLEARLDRTLNCNYRSPANRRLANHLRREREAMFTFLYCPGLDATNYRAEQAIRPMVVTRKVWAAIAPSEARTHRACWSVSYRHAASSSGPQPHSAAAAPSVQAPSLGVDPTNPR